MKKLQLLLATLVCSLVFASTASAYMVSPVQFFAKDTSGDGKITMSILNIDANPLLASTLQYALGSNPSNWIGITDWTLNPLTITLNGAKQEIMNFRLMATSTPITSADMLFISTFGNGTYDQAIITWTGYGNFTLSSATAGDSFAPVPVPPAAYLLASGVVGLITLRRRKAANLA